MIRDRNEFLTHSGQRISDRDILSHSGHGDTFVEIRDPDTNELLGKVKERGYRQLHSEASKKREVSEEEKRITRDRNRQLAEDKANDELVEARAEHEAFRSTRLKAQATLGTGIVGVVGVPTLDSIVGLSAFFIAPFVLSILLIMIGGAAVIAFVGDKTEYGLQKAIREKENNYRDVVQRPISHYKPT